MTFKEKIELFIGGIFLLGRLLFFAIMIPPWIFYELCGIVATRFTR